MRFSLVKSGSAGVINGEPMRKCPGVNGVKSLGSSLAGLKGREFKQDSIRVRIVDSSSKVNFILGIIFRKWVLRDLTPASQSPPM